MTPIRLAIVATAAIAFVVAIPRPGHAGCMIQAEYAKNVMTHLFNPAPEAWAAMAEEYEFYSQQGPHWKHAVLNRALAKVDYLLALPRFNPLDPVTAERNINGFRTTTFLACKAGVS